MARYRIRDTQFADWRGAPRRFDKILIALHWTTAALILGMFTTAFTREALADGDPAKLLLLTIHRSLGVTVWAVVICRLAWRLGFAFLPPFAPSMTKPQQTFAKFSEYGLYAFLLIQPLTGLGQTLASGRPFVLFGWEIAPIIARNDSLRLVLHVIHEFSAFAFLSLIALHVLAVLLDGFVLGDHGITSMLPASRRTVPVREKIGLADQ